MTIQLLDTVVLTRDMPEHKLREGDVGAVVEVYPPSGIEVEFVTGAGRTQALVTLKMSEVRPFGATDILAVRRLDAA
jgi:hypothetical protein